MELDCGEEIKPKENLITLLLFTVSYRQLIGFSVTKKEKIINSNLLSVLILVIAEVKDTGFKYDGVFHKVPEMIPEIIVPDLTDCQVSTKLSCYLLYSPN